MNFYNENDPRSAAWLRELIKEGHIPAGDVDERSILDIRATDLAGYTQCHFFAGIGGWPYALQLAGWPEDRPVWTGSCPCQPFSCAGKGMGESDERHLWPYFRNLIGLCRPPIVFGEQVASPLGRGWLAGVRADMERAAYAFGASDLCAAGVKAPHKRQRNFWVAHSIAERCAARGSSEPGQTSGRTLVEHSSLMGVAMGDTQQPRLEGHAGDVQNGSKPGRQREEAGRPATEAGGADGLADPSDLRRAQHEHESRERGTKGPEDAAIRSWVNPWARFDILHMLDGKARRIESGSFPLAHGVPGRVGLLRGYGNAIVPEAAAEFIMAFLQSEQS